MAINDDPIFFYKENLYRITENNSSKKKVKLDCD